MLDDAALEKLGYVRMDAVSKLLNYGSSIAKRLDEHRELAEAIESGTELFVDAPWHVNHMAVQDDYLMRIYFMVHGWWPDTVSERERRSGGIVRDRPKLLGACELPEYELPDLKGNIDG